MKKILIILQLIITINALSQDKDFCGTPESTDSEMEQKPWYYDNDYLKIIENAKEQLVNNTLNRKSNFTPGLIINPISIPIRFWIYEDAANNTFIANDRQWQDLIDQLNFLYQSNGMDLRFYMHCNQIIDDADALVVSPFEAFNRFSRNRDIHAIDVHIVEDYEGAAGVSTLLEILLLLNKTYSIEEGMFPFLLTKLVIFLI